MRNYIPAVIDYIFLNLFGDILNEEYCSVWNIKVREGNSSSKVKISFPCVVGQQLYLKNNNIYFLYLFFKNRVSQITFVAKYTL